MASKRPTTSSVWEAERDSGLTELGRELVAQIAGGEPTLAAGAHASGGGDLTAATGPSLDLRDLIRDDNGEVVLYNDSGLSWIGITADRAVVARGQAEAHVTATGEDVSGFRFLTFEDGLTLYYQDGLELIVHSQAT